MDIIDSMIATTSDAPHKYCLAIRAALAVGSQLLNKYYNKTDYSEVYRISMGALRSRLSAASLMAILLVLHPRHKLEYFKKAGWPESWIQMASDLVRDEFDMSYASVPIVSASVGGPEASVDDHVRPLLLPSDFRALLTALFYKSNL